MYWRRSHFSCRRASSACQSRCARTPLSTILGHAPGQVPVGLFDAINGFLDFLASIFPNLVDTAEFGKIGKYYAVESMLACPRVFISWLRHASPLTGLSATLPAQVMDPATGRYEADLTPSYGTDTLRAFYAKACTLADRFFHCAHPPTDSPGASGV